MQSGYANNLLLCRILAYYIFLPIRMHSECFPIEFVFNFIWGLTWGGTPYQIKTKLNSDHNWGIYAWCGCYIHRIAARNHCTLLWKQNQFKYRRGKVYDVRCECGVWVYILLRFIRFKAMETRRSSDKDHRSQVPIDDVTVEKRFVSVYVRSERSSEVNIIY